MFWQIGGAVDTTAPVRASAGSAPGRARLLTWGYVQYEIRPDGVAHPTAEQDRSRRDRSATEEGIALVTAALPRGPIGPYQLQAAIAALHDEAHSPEATDWPQIAALYDVLLRLDDNPVVAPTHAVAISMVAGPRAGLELVRRLGTGPGSTPVVASARSWATSSSALATLLPRSRRTEPQPGWPRTSGSSATSTDRSLACRAGRPPDSDFEGHTGLEGELGFGLDRIRMALRSFSVNRDNCPLLKAAFG